MKAVKKEFCVQIVKTYNRFLSILLIVALGAAFYAGICSTEPDMRLSADKLYDDTNLMDIEIVSTMGLSDYDVEALNSLDSVELAVGTYSEDVITSKSDAECVTTVYAYTDEVNVVQIVDGRLPKDENECIVDEQFLEQGFAIGDTVKMESENFTQSEFTIVGTFTSSMYIALDKGTSSIGNGEVSGIIVVCPEAFNLDTYTEIYVLANGAKELTCYTDEYDDYIDEVSEYIEDNIMDDCIANRYSEIVDDANAEIDEAQTELDKSTEEYEDALEELEAAEDAIAENEQKLEEAKSEIEDGWAQIKEAKAKLKESEKTLDESKTTVSESEAALEAAKEEYNSGLEEYEAGLTALEIAKEEVLNATSEYTVQLSEYNKQLEAYEDAAELYGEDAMAETRAALDAYKAELDAASEQIALAEAEIAENEEMLSQSKIQLDAAALEIEAAGKQLEEAKAQIASAEQTIKSGYAEIAQNEQTLIDSEAEIEKSEEQLKEAKEEIEDGKKELEEAKEQIDDAQAEIDEAKADVLGIEEPEWYVLDRSSIQTYEEYGQNAGRIGNIGKVFPVIFFIVAAMVSLNTMTRMVEEERTKIGTFKALGYSRRTIALKYILYGFLATAIGSVFGGILGSKLLPYIIINAYKIMYVNQPNVLLPINTLYFTIAILASVVSVIGATLIACIRTLRSTPAELMRPASPKLGKRVFLEKIPFIWKRLSFQHKSTVRNLFRYKKRLLMTLFGISGCMALMLVGFGVKDSVNSIIDIQYGSVEKYNIMVSYSDSSDEEGLETLHELFNNTDEVEDYMQVYLSAVDVEDGDDEMSVYMCVPENTDDIDSYIDLHNRKTDEKYTLDESGVVISEKMADLLDVDEGDILYIKEDGEVKYEITIKGICEYYVYHYIYMSPELYKEIYGKSPEYNTALLISDENISAYSEEMTEEYLEYDEVSGVTFTEDTKGTFSEMLGMLDIVVLVLVISAGALAFIVLYNLNNINIAERIRELATLKVLGFYDSEVSAYVFRENIVITVMGMFIGLFLGIILHRYVIMTAELDTIMFGRNINFASYIYSILLTLLFSLIINISMHFKLKKVDMATSLKSVE